MLPDCSHLVVLVWTIDQILWRECNPKVGRFKTEVYRDGITLKPPLSAASRDAPSGPESPSCSLMVTIPIVSRQITKELLSSVCLRGKPILKLPNGRTAEFHTCPSSPQLTRRRRSKSRGASLLTWETHPPLVIPSEADLSRRAVEGSAVTSNQCAGSPRSAD